MRTEAGIGGASGVEARDAAFTRRLLRPLLMLAMPVTLAWAVITSFIEGGPGLSTAAVLGLLVTQAVCMHVLLRGRHRLAGVLFTASIWVTVTVSVVYDEGVFGEAYLIYAGVVAIAALAVGPRAAVFTAGATIIASAVIASAMVEGGIEPAFDDGPLVAWLLGSTALAITAYAVYSLRREGGAAMTDYAALRDRIRRRGQLLEERARRQEEAFDRLVQERTAELGDVNRRLRDSEEVLRASEQHYRELFLGAHDAILIIDAQERTVIEANPQACELYGYRHDELVGLPTAALSVDLPFVVDPMTRTLAAGRLRFLETVQRRKDGREIHVEINATVVEVSGRNAVLSFNRDITARRLAERELEARDEQLRQVQKMEAIGRLAAGVAHDFNNLLTAVQSYSVLAAKSLEPGHPARRDLGEIQAAGDRAARLATKLLAFARRQVLEPEVLDLRHLVEELAAMLQRMVAPGVHLEVRHAHGPATVNADRGQLEQVLLNLVVNAQDAMPKGGALTLSTRAAVLADGEVGRLPAGAYVVATVRDTGVGIPADELARVFEPFFTTKALGRGTGLGLATVYGIVQQSGGAVLVHSVEGEGTQFDVYLPACGEVATPRRTLDDSTPLPRTRGRVLLVDDDEQARRSAKAILSRAGLDVIDTSNAGEALLLFERHPHFDAVISDVYLPLVDGIGLAERLRRVRSDVPVVFVSGLPSGLPGAGSSEDGAATAMADPLVRKPFTPEQLLETVRTAIKA